MRCFAKDEEFDEEEQDSSKCELTEKKARCEAKRRALAAMLETWSGFSAVNLHLSTISLTLCSLSLKLRTRHADDC